MFKLNEKTATKNGVVIPVLTEKHGIEVYQLYLHNDDGLKKIGEALSERKILNLAYQVAA